MCSRPKNIRIIEPVLVRPTSLPARHICEIPRQEHDQKSTSIFPGRKRLAQKITAVCILAAFLLTLEPRVDPLNEISRQPLAYGASISEEGNLLNRSCDSNTPIL